MPRFCNPSGHSSERSIRRPLSDRAARFSGVARFPFVTVRLLLPLLAWCLAGGGGVLAQSQAANPCAGVPPAAATLGDLLQGKLPGVTVLQLGGASGGASQIRLRGINSTHTKNPIILIDNIRVTPLGYRGERGLHSVALLEMVNPADIARVEVLRGPAATIQYGDAADGVIRIFTRRGNEQAVAQDVARSECKTEVRKP